MATYTQYSQSWLEDTTVIRIILVVAEVYNNVTSTTNTVYFSNAPYVTTDGSILFNPVIRRNVTLSETLTPDGTGAMTFGDIELDNQNGELDEYLDSTKYVWSNTSIKIYYGDPQWVCENLSEIQTKFLTIFNGIIDDIDSRVRNTLNIKFRDKLERLNTPLTETKLGTYGTWNGGQTNQDSIVPVVLGEVFNISPLLIDPSTLEYQYNSGNTEGIVEVRDNGYPIYNLSRTGGANITLSTGKFKLTKQPAGTITCSIKGVAESVLFSLTGGNYSASYTTYRNDIAAVVAEIVTRYGKSSTRLSFSDLDLENFYNFQQSNAQPIGIVINDTTNVLTVIRQIASSLGCQVYFNRVGLLQILQYGTPFSNNLAVTSIDNTDIMYNSLEIIQRPAVIGSIKIGYCKNYTVQNSLTTSIPQNHKDSYNEEWLTTTVNDNTTINLYKLSSDAQQQDTQLITTASAQGEATRRLNLYKTQKMIIKFRGTSRLLSLKLGQAVLLTHERFGLELGKQCQVISLSPNWTTNTVDVEVLV